MHNFHLLALPVRDRKTAENLFGMAKKALDAIITEWRKKLIGISTDGENAMTGRLGGLVTLFQRAVDGNDLFRIWCVLHQLDLVVQKAYKKLHDDDFIQELTACVSHLRRQQNLISAMGSTCPMHHANAYPLGPFTPLPGVVYSTPHSIGDAFQG